MTDFILEVTDSDGRPLSDAQSAELRRALVDHGALTAAAAGQARFADPATLLAITVGAIQTAAAVTEVVNFLQAWRSSRGGRVRVAGAELPTEPIGEDSPFVAAVLRHAGKDSQRRFALVVAVNSYDDPGLNALRSPATDARALTEVLSDKTIGGYQVEVVSDADERTVRRRIGEFFADRDPDDLLLLHFSCHGVKDRQNRLHLAARDTELRSLGATSIPASFVDSQMAQTSARRVVLVLDCCFSGAYATDMTARADRKVNIDDEFGHSGRVVLTASSATEYAFEGNQLTDSAAQPSIFTSALVKGLRTGEADLDGDGQITVDDWYTYAYRAVTAAGAGQAPTKSSSGVSGAFIVASSVRGAAIPADLREDLDSDRVPVRLAAVERLAALAARGGGAQITARRELQRLVSDDDSVRVRNAAANALGESQLPEPKVAPPPPPPPRVVPAPALAPAPVRRPVTVPGMVTRAAGVLLLVAAAFRLFALSSLDSDELDLYDTNEAYSMELGVIVLLALCGLALAALPKLFRPVLAVVAGLAPWAVWTAMSSALYAVSRNDAEEPSFWGRLPQLVALVFAVALLLWTQRGKRPGNQLRGFVAFGLAAVLVVLAMLGVTENYTRYSLIGPAGLAAATLSLTVVYFGAAVQELRPYLLTSWTVVGAAWALTSGQAGFAGNESAGIPGSLAVAATVGLALMLVLAFVPWPDKAAGEETGSSSNMPGDLAKAAMGLVVGSLALWILLAAFDWRVWPTSQLWLDFLPIAAAASIVLAVFRTPECAAFLTGFLGWPLALIVAVPGEPSYRTPTLEGEPAHSVDPGSAMVWGLLVCAAVLPTLRYLRTAPTDSSGPQWTGGPAVLVLFLLGFATWMCWDIRGLTYPLIAGAAVAAPTAMLWGRRGIEHASALLGAATGAVPVLITVLSFRDQYSQGWSAIAVGVAIAAFALAAVTAMLSNPARIGLRQPA